MMKNATKKPLATTKQHPVVGAVVDGYPSTVTATFDGSGTCTADAVGHDGVLMWDAYGGCHSTGTKTGDYGDYEACADSTGSFFQDNYGYYYEDRDGCAYFDGSYYD
jgi:hypothetical protein